jgi:hypothetical protein
MAKRVYIIYGILFLHICVYAQIHIQSQLIDSLDGEVIQFANIGIVGKGLGTVSDENGKFSITIPDSLTSQHLKISIIGYETQSIPINSKRIGKIIKMSRQSAVLHEVTVTPRSQKTKRVGNQTRSNFYTGGFINNSLGAELAVRISIKNPNTFLQKFMIHISRNSLDTTPVFRFNVYSVTKDGSPGENILKDNIIIAPNEKTGFLEFDLKPYAIVVDDDVFIAIEWIKDLGNAKGLYFSTKMIGSGMHFRQTSQDKWLRSKSIGIGLHAEIAY